MEKAKQIINHPLAKAILAGFIGTMLLVEAHPLYAGVAFRCTRQSIGYYF